MTAPQIGHDAGCSDCDRDFGSNLEFLVFIVIFRTIVGHVQYLLLGSRGILGRFAFGCDESVPLVAVIPSV